MSKRPAQPKSTGEVVESVAEVLDDDVLIGRGFQYEDHPGNVVFHETLQSFLAAFDVASTRKDKTAVVKQIYQQLQTTSRFLKYNSTTGLYDVVNEKEARQKISHALRYQCQLENETKTSTQVSTQSSSQRSETTVSDAGGSTCADEDTKVAAASFVGDPERVASAVPASTQTVVGVKRARSDDDEDSLFSHDQLESVLGRPEEFALPRHAPGSPRQALALPPSATRGGATEAAASAFPRDDALPAEHLHVPVFEEPVPVAEGPLFSLEGDSPPSKDKRR